MREAHPAGRKRPAYRSASPVNGAEGGPLCLQPPSGGLSNGRPVVYGRPDARRSLRALCDGRAFVLLLLALAGCASREGESRDAAPRLPVAVQAVTLRPATIARVVEQPG